MRLTDKNLHLQSNIQLEKQLKYWKQQLANATPVLELPTDKPRLAVPTYQSAKLSFVLPQSLSAALDTLSQQQDVTLFMTLLAAFKTLLHRYSGQQDILVGSPIVVENERLNGLKANTLVLRTDISGNSSFQELLQKVRSVVLQAKAHQDLPFEKLVEELQPEQLSYHPLFQVMFVLQNQPKQTLDLSGLTITPSELDKVTSKLDLTLSMEETEQGFKGEWEYNAELFDKATITRINGNFQTLLEGIVAHPNRSISELPLLSVQEQQLLLAWNNTQADYPKQACIHELFEAQVEQTPDAVAVVFGSEQLTYKQLNQRANQLAHYLRELGVKPDDLVGICVERSLLMVVGLFAILKAGGAYVPLDPAYPQERLNYILSDAQVSLLLTDSSPKISSPQLPINKLPINKDVREDTVSPLQVVCIDTDWDRIATTSTENPPPCSTVADLAYVIYTSGSTGKPKGVEIPHGAVVNFLTSMQRQPGLTQADVVLAVTTISFDIAVLELYLPLITGARIDLVTREVASDGRLLSEQIAASGATVMQATPATWRMLLAAGWGGVPGLKILCGGEALPSDLAQQLLATGAAIWNMYGPTETTVWSTVFEVAATQLSQTSIPIGRPIANTQIYLLDSNLQPVPIGVPGELHIGGDGLARGYLNARELTAQKFIRNPFSQEQGSRLYKTGDLARYLPDGNIDYIGRIDNQVKIRGFRIELGEIEAVLRQHPSVLQPVVIAREDVPGDKRLVAYVVVKPEHIPSSLSELRRFLKEQLPDYMVPTAFVFLDTLPLTPNGKIDRRALPAPDASHFISDNNFVAPRNSTEEVLAAIWAQVLGLARVGIHDNFFELGGHSLLATQVISRIRQGFGVEISLQLLFETPTIADLATAITQNQNQSIDEHQTITRVANRQSAPLSYVQQQLWLLAQLEPDSAAYNIVEAMQLQGELNVNALQQSLDAIVAHHEILRTTYIALDGNPVQIIGAPRSVELKVINLGDEPLTENTKTVQQLLQNEALRPFNLTSDLMLRACLIQRSPARARLPAGASPQENILLLVMHHIATDGWSMSILYEELTTLYQAFNDGLSNPLPELPIQYADFAVWQREWLSGEVLQKQLNYWKQQLAGATPILELPADRPRPPVQSYRGARQFFVLPQSLSQALHGLSRQEGVTLFMTLLAAFQTLLYRYSRQEDILVGSPIAGRNREEIEGLIGFFVNTLVLRTDMSGNPNFRELLQRVRSTAMSAYAHQDLPFEKLVEQLQPERSLSYHPLFQVMFVLQNVPNQTLELPGLSITAVDVDHLASQFDITLSIEETQQGLRGLWEYNTDLFDERTIERMSEHFQTLLEAIVTDPQQHVTQLPLLTPNEQHQLLVEWNNTQADYPQQCIHKLFEQQVEKTPDAVAVVFVDALCAASRRVDKQLTYQQLNNRANQLAHYLQTLGVGPDVLVGIYIERSLEMVVGLLGILKAGGAYVPLDPEYPQERLEFMLEDTQTPVLLTQEKLVNSLPTHKAQVICLDSEWELIAQHSEENPVSEVTIENLVYIIYTSGSTGKPKGVMIAHRGVCNHLYWRQATFQLTEQDKVLQTFSLNFDPSVWQIFWPLSFGGQLFLARPGGHQDPTYLVKVITEQQITIAGLVPSIIRVLLEEKGIENCTCLRHVTSGGEGLGVEFIDRFVERLNLHNVLLNCYGPTEGCIDVTSWTCQPGANYTIAPIGRPTANVQVYILDENLQPVPVGQSGELHIGGVGLARGYLNRPELTKEKFIRNPFSSVPGARLYKTGDLARYLPDGNIEFLGRIDHQVKIRGFRIELGEIEATLGQHPALQQNLVIVREDIPGDKRLVAYVVVHPEQVAPTSSELRGFLQGKLPEYMVPKAFVFLDVIPLNPNGKVDRRALRAPDTADFSDANSFVEPRNATEEVLAAIWAQVLGLERVGMHDNFFEFGGNSLLATQVISRIRQRFDVEIPLRLLFETPTIAGLANAITSLSFPTERSANANGHQSTNVLKHQTIPQLTERHSVPLSFAQQRVWFLEQMEPNSAAYLIPIAQRLQGLLNVGVLQQSLDAIVAHHEALRTNFIASDDGTPIQVISAPRSVELKVIDLTHEHASNQEEQVQCLLNQEAQRPFDLTSDLMLRATLLQIDHQEHILLLVMHHIASDGWSMGILWQQLAAVYQAFLNGLANPLPTLPIQYADFAVWQRQWLSGEVLSEQLDYWKTQLAGATTVLELPTDKPRPRVQTYRAAMQSLMLPQTLAASLSALSRQEGITLFMTLLSAFGTLLHRYTGQEDILIGSPVAGRTRTEIEQLIGFFINTVVLRIDCSAHPSFGSLLNRVRQMALGAYAHQDMPFEKLVEELQPERDTSRNPLFQVWFNMLNLGDMQVELPGLVVEPISIPEAASKFDLNLYVTEQQQGIQLELVYNADLFAPERMMEMLHQFHHLLIQIVENPQQSIASLSLVTPKAELLLPNAQQQLLPQWEEAVHTRFAQQAQRMPQQLAVVDAQLAWTYAELEQRANQLANYLLANNIQSQDIVAIYGDRSASLVWAILGVLKAGAAFVILDPAYPASRLIDCLDLIQPRAWLQIAAGELPPSIQNYLETVSCDCRLQLPSGSMAEVGSLLQDYASGDLGVMVEPNQLAYVAFTSGSTGKPKGIKGTHRPLSHFVHWHGKTFGLNQSDKFSMLSGLSHDPLLRDIFTPLSLGATLCIPQQQNIETPGKLADWMRQMQISVAHLTPAMAQLVTANTNSNTTDLRYVFFGGDVLTQQDVTRIRNFAPNTTCVNFYGATETPQAMGYFIIPNDSLGEESSFKETIPLGQGIEDVQLLVLSPKLQLAGIGEVGEIYVRTPYLASGYVGSDELTQERFIINPLTNITEDRLYKTGDLGRYLPDGNIEFLGRSDNQVKIRGFRIELGEIEAILGQYPAVQEAVVSAREDVHGEMQLVAYVVTKPKQVCTTEELRSFLKEKLPNYMIPTAIVMLDALPLTPNGKVNRRVLPAPDLSRQQPEETFVAPRDELEQKLSQIWEQVLGVQPISVTDNFFELGGHSLIAVKLFWQIEKTFGKNLPLATLFQSGTVEALASIIRQEENVVSVNQASILESPEVHTSLQAEMTANLPSQKESSVSWSSLVPIQPKGSKPPFFCIHAIGGNLLSFYNLANHIEPDQPLYGLQAQGLDGQQTPYDRVEEMAAHYLREIQTVQPHGPYFLGGHCFGGIVAYEIAQQLHRQGEKVGLLVLFDSTVPGSDIRLSFRQRLPLHLKKLLTQGPTYIQTKIEGWLGWFRHMFMYYKNKIAEKFYQRVAQSVESTLPIDVRNLRVREANYRAVEAYVLQPYPNRLTVFRVADELRVKDEGYILDPNMGWKELAVGGLEFHYVPGDHLSMLEEPHVKSLAEKLQARIAQAQRDIELSSH
ncbi:amino acid adenylation domain-containing protein [Tolypothrix campylonemoides VB511288]|nr:amino acid adenylation domain-containing protein [Tolypothrix campylonemoides VB511288]